MKLKGLAFIGLLLLSYYLIYLGLAGIGIPYLPLPTYNGYSIVLGDPLSFGLIALGFVMFAVSYMEVENIYNFKIKLMSKHHCEKIITLYVGTIIALVYIFYLMFTGKYVYPIEWFWLALLTWASCLAGIIYYKLMNKKPITPKTVILFWKDK